MSYITNMIELIEHPLKINKIMFNKKLYYSDVIELIDGNIYKSENMEIYTFYNVKENVIDELHNMIDYTDDIYLEDMNELDIIIYKFLLLRHIKSHIHKSNYIAGKIGKGGYRWNNYCIDKNHEFILRGYGINGNVHKSFLLKIEIIKDTIYLSIKPKLVVLIKLVDILKSRYGGSLKNIIRPIVVLNAKENTIIMPKIDGEYFYHFSGDDIIINNRSYKKDDLYIISSNSLNTLFKLSDKLTRYTSRRYAGVEKTNLIEFVSNILKSECKHKFDEENQIELKSELMVI